MGFLNNVTFLLHVAIQNQYSSKAMLITLRLNYHFQVASQCKEYEVYTMEDTEKKRKQTRSGIDIFKLSIPRNSISIRTLLKLLLGFNSKTEQEKKNFSISKLAEKRYTAKKVMVLNILIQYFYIWFLSVN